MVRAARARRRRRDRPNTPAWHGGSDDVPVVDNVNGPTAFGTLPAQQGQQGAAEKSLGAFARHGCAAAADLSQRLASAQMHSCSCWHVGLCTYFGYSW